MVPKWHDALHLPKQYCGGYVFDTLCNERDNQNPKAFADLMRAHFDAFERVVLARSIAFQMKALKSFDERPCLVSPIVWSRDIGAEIASALNFKGIHVAIGDYITTADDVVMRVTAC